MSTLDLESLVVTVGFFGSLAGATFALSENKRRLLKSTGESFTFNPYLKVGCEDPIDRLLIKIVKCRH